MLYIGLFLNAFVAATLLPAFSEVTLAGLVATKQGEVWFLFLAATSGNVAGSTLNWLLGRSITRFENRSWFPVKGPAYDRACNFFQRHGRWSLLFAWAPIIGDPLTLIAGTLRIPLLSFLVLVTIGKGARYALVAFGTDILAGN